MTTFSGLVLIDHYLRLYRIHQRVRKTFKSFHFKGDYGIADILMCLLIMLMVGAQRLRHIDFVKDDPLFKRIVRLTRIPHRTKLSTALKQFTSDSLKALAELNAELVIEQIKQLGLDTVTIDLDGTVISTRGNPSWAFAGYNPIKRGAKSYFPLTAHVGQTGHFLSIVNRPGNVHDSNRALSVIKTLRRQMADFQIQFRADSAFCVPDVINYLRSRHHNFAIKVPFWKLKNLKAAVVQRKRWFRINTRWSYFWVKNPIDSIDHDHWVMILRKKVKRCKGHYQLKLFSPDNGQFEYSAVVTESKNWAPDDLLSFMAGRSAQENSISELKTSFAFDHVPTNTYQANSAYQQLSQMAYNLSISMQYGMGLATKRNCGKKVTRLYRTYEWRTLRFTFLNRAGRIVTMDGRKHLLVSKNEATRSLYSRIASALVDASRKLAA